MISHLQINIVNYRNVQVCMSEGIKQRNFGTLFITVYRKSVVSSKLLTTLLLDLDTCLWGKIVKKTPIH